MMRLRQLVHAIFSAAALLFIAATASAYQLGHRVVTYQDPARGNRSIATDVYYPADVAGDNVPVAAPPAGGFPVVSFGHGFLIGSNLYSFVRDIALDGYVVALPATEGSVLPNHANFGEDLAFLVNKLKAEGANSASFLFGAVGARGAVGGHSMGGGATFLGANGDAGVDAVFNFAAANTNPSSITAAAGVTVPTLVIAAKGDCVAAPSSNQLPMYNASAAACRAYVELDGASHCQFNDYNLTCDLGEFCSASISRGTQFQLVTTILVPWLDAVLKNAAFAWDDFQTALAADSRYAVLQNCPVPPEPACSNGIDDDGDGLIDHPGDPGCSDTGDDSEHTAEFICDDGLDNDGDGLVDWPTDVGCFDLYAAIENPKCDNDIDDDGDGGIDWDGGSTAAAPDSYCEGRPFRNLEAPSSCGIGIELVLALPLIAALRRRRAARG